MTRRAKSKRAAGGKVSGRAGHVRELSGSGRVPAGPKPPPDAVAAKPRKRNYARWRALSLSLVYIVFALHILHWKLTGTTLAPLELNEVMYTLELGIITAGFLFMCFLVLGSLLFGRFFCSWACHIMVLQDLCAWLLRKIGIRAKPVRSRLLLLVPPLTAAYMFLWPQIVRAYHDHALPTFHIATDRQGWASFVTNNFWRNLPGPTIIIITFLVCGFAIVYLMGSRTFCTYICPYGAIFALADRFSPARIKVSDACKQCGTCTAACTTGIRVHDEVKQHGMIVNPACLKDLDCVAACPQGALSYGLGKPALFKSYTSGGRFGRVPYEFSPTEELLAAIVFVVSLLSFRGLYAQFPFLLSLAMGAILGYLSVVTVRLITRPHVAMSKLILKDRGRLGGAGYAFVGLAAVLAAFVLHSALVRYHEYTGLRAADALTTAATPQERDAEAALAFDRLAVANRWGLVSNPKVERGLLRAALHLERFDDAERYARRLLERHVFDAESHFLLGQVYVGREQPAEAEREFRALTAPWAAETEYVPAAVVSGHQALGGLLVKRGDFSGAVGEFERAVKLEPNRGAALAELGSAYVELGRLDEAATSLRRAIELDPQLGRAHYNLATILAHQGEFDEAVLGYEKALALLPDDADVANNLGAALRQLGRLDEARSTLERAIELDPQHADAHFNLGVVLAGQQREVEAHEQFSIAVRLDPRYAQFLTRD